jgi:hypothetical protein
MINQSEIKTFLDKLKRQVKGFRQIPKISKAPLKSQSVGIATEPYAGEPLEIGNELLITVEIVNMFRGLSNALGRVVIIDQMPAKTETTVKASAFGIQVEVAMNVAQQMRAAYILREQT